MRAIGIAFLLVSLIAGIVLLVSGNLCSSQVIDVASGGTSTSRWEVSRSIRRQLVAGPYVGSGCHLRHPPGRATKKSAVLEKLTVFNWTTRLLFRTRRRGLCGNLLHTPY
jgi:hypothetical protein